MGPFVCRSIGHNYLKGRKVYFQDPIGALVCIRITEENHHGNFYRRDYIKVHGYKQNLQQPFFHVYGDNMYVYWKKNTKLVRQLLGECQTQLPKRKKLFNSCYADVNSPLAVITAAIINLYDSCYEIVRLFESKQSKTYLEI